MNNRRKMITASLLASPAMIARSMPPMAQDDPDSPIAQNRRRFPGTMSRLDSLANDMPPPKPLKVRKVGTRK